MTKKHNQSTVNALHKYCNKYFGEDKPKKKKTRNKKPEKIVEAECLKYMRNLGWNVQIYESKAVWNSQSQTWSQAGMKYGNSDCMGSMPEGIMVAVEFKAPGSLSTFNREERHLQKQFIIDKIKSNAFACVVDSASLLDQIYSKWKKLRAESMEKAQAFLMDSLPKMREKTRLKEEKLFDE